MLSTIAFWWGVIKEIINFFFSELIDTLEITQILTDRQLGPVHTCPFLSENGDFFFNGLKYRPHVSGENGHGKRIFSKTLFGVEILENAENGGFRIRRCRSSYTTSITHTLWGMLSCFHRFEYTTTTCGFFRKRRGKSPFSKIIRGYCFTFLYFTFDVVNARKGDGTLVVVSRSYAVIKYKPTFV